MAEETTEQNLGGTLPTSSLLDQHYTMVVKAILDGRVVPFLGAGVNLCDRSEKGLSLENRDLSQQCSGVL